MNVIWQDDKYTQFHIWEMNRDFVPPFLNDLSIFIEIHFPVNDFSKQAFPSLYHNRDVIRAFR